MIDKLFRNLREIIFWSRDSLKGKLIKSAFKEIKIIDELDSENDYIKNYHNKKFEKLSLHATKTTQFYRQFADRKHLKQFPVINKNSMKSKQEDFISIKYDKNKLFEMSTGGSTGIPFISYQDNIKKRRVNAEIIYYSQKIGYSVGDKLIFLRAITKNNNKSILKQWIENQKLIDITELNDNKINELLEKIKRSSENGSVILAYASTFDVLKNYFTRNNVDFLKENNVMGIISSAEMLYDDTRSSMQEKFNCDIVSRYSNQENGVIGQDEERNNVFIINEANYIVEILNFNNDSEVTDGVVGRIVITDLYNRAMPFIRYDTGDVGSIIKVKSKGRIKRAISSFGGRKEDMIFDCNGNLLSPHSIINYIWRFPEINQYQFIQESENEYKIKINTKEKFLSGAELKTSMLNLLGSKAHITVEEVNEIPVLASGKRKSIVNLIS